MIEIGRPLRTGRPAFTLIVLAVFLALVVVACSSTTTGTTNDLQLTLDVEPAVPAVGEAMLRVTVTDRDGQPVDDAVVGVEGNMIHPGMVPVMARAEQGVDGTYMVPFTWTMSGDWVISITARVPDGRQGQADFPFTVEGN